MKKILHLTLFLAIISAVAGGALGFFNDLTAPIIEENALASVKVGLEKIFKGANFKEADVKGEQEFIQNIYEADGKGVVYKVGVQGFKDQIIFLIGVDKDGNFAGYDVQQNNDTQGFGTRVNDEEFYGAFVGESIDTEVDTLSGATVSSTAVVKGIKEVVEYNKANY